MIRNASESDAAAMGEIYCETWKSAYAGLMPEGFLSSLTAQDCTPASIDPDGTVIAEANGKAVGLAAFGEAREDGETLGELRAIYVLPQYQKSGFGKELFCAASERLRSAGFDGFYLWVLRGNTRARNFYERMGMLDTAARRSITVAESELEECRYECRF